MELLFRLLCTCIIVDILPRADAHTYERTNAGYVYPSSINYTDDGGESGYYINDTLYDYHDVEVEYLEIVINKTSDKNDILQTWQNLMDFFCPRGKFCSEKIITASQIPPKHEACCKDCSCDDDCGLDGNKVCCFPETPEAPPSQHKECLPLQYSERVYVAPHYYIITDCPANYALNAENQELAESCRGNRSILSLLPAFSKQTHLIYRNKFCAKCHGTDDVIVFTPYLSCPSDMEDVSFEIRKNKIPDRCHLYYQYGNHADIQHLRCCPKTFDFEYPGMALHLTRQSVISLCENGPYSPYKVQMGNNLIDTYSNIFCSVCSSNTSRFIMISVCSKYSSFAVNPTTLLSMLDITLIEEVANSEDTHIVPKYEACRKLSSGEKECRQLLCPAMKNYNLAGECINVVDGWLVEEVHVSLKLIPDGIFPFCTLEDFLHNKTLKSILHHHWSRHWSIAKVFLPSMSCNCSQPLLETCMSYFGVTMKLAAELVTKGKHLMETDHLTREVKGLILKDWFIQLNTTFATLKSHFLDFQIRGGSATPHLEKDSRQIAKHIYFNDKLAVEITKLHYCEQVELRNDEFELYDFDVKDENLLTAEAIKLHDAEAMDPSHIRFLYLKELRKVLLPRQFGLHSSANQRHFLTVCLSDTPFTKVSGSSCTKMNCLFLIMCSVVWASVFIK